MRKTLLPVDRRSHVKKTAKPAHESLRYRPQARPSGRWSRAIPAAPEVWAVREIASDGWSINPAVHLRRVIRKGARTVRIQGLSDS
jgi:hypothetical protein